MDQKYEEYVPDYEHKRKVCSKCVYSKGFYHKTPQYIGDLYCDYMCMTGKLRPCPAAQCTEFKPRPVNKKKKKNRGPDIKY